MSLKDQFIAILTSYKVSVGTIEDFWREIEIHYSDGNRQYHTLIHLENLYKELFQVKDSIVDWDVMIFSLVYHDIIYKVHRSNNEIKSAAFAEERMHRLGIPKEKIVKCKEQIVATKLHEPSDDSDTNYFLDADLSVLGNSVEAYKKYIRDIREEFRFYPDILYNRGRKKVISHFLGKDRIYNTQYFYDTYEDQARKNLQWELENI